MTPSYQLPRTSVTRLVGVHDALQRVVTRAAEITAEPFVVVEGLRTKARQAQLYAQGRTVPGRIVTWTMASKHIEGRAVDVAPVDAHGNILWDDLPAFDRLSHTMMEAAKDVGVGLVWGANWDGDTKPHEKGETDSPHFQLADSVA